MNRPWIGVQYWERPVFLHWPVPYEILRPHVPQPFQLDTFHGQPWVSIVCFRSPRSSLRWGSRLFSLGSSLQVNVRTYIRFYEEPAVYFLNVFTDSKLSVLGARLLLSLPYQLARFVASAAQERLSLSMNHSKCGQTWQFSAHVDLPSSYFPPEKHTLAYWLTERYHIYTIKRKRIVKAAISHSAWQLSETQSNIAQNNLLGMTPETSHPLVHVGISQTTRLYLPEIKGWYH